MRMMAFLLTTMIAATNARAVEWALEINITASDGKEYQEHFVTSKEGINPIMGPNGWICMLKVDEIRKSLLQDGKSVTLQKAYIGCKASDDVMVSTAAAIAISPGILFERDANLTLGGNNEFSMRLVPCFSKYSDECKKWKTMKW